MPASIALWPGDGARSAGQARTTHDLAERYREQYRRRLESWVALRNRLENRTATGASSPAATASRPPPLARPSRLLRSEHDALGRDLAVQQAQLKRIQAAAHQLDLLHTYLLVDRSAGRRAIAGGDGGDACQRPPALIEAQEGERQRLAEEVHDGPAQVLTNAIFQVEYLDRVIDDSRRAPPTRSSPSCGRMLRDGLDEVRGFIAELRPPAVDVGLAQAINDRVAEFGERHGIGVTMAVEGIDARLGPEAKASVLRIVQEALQNVRKHSAATEVRITLEGDHLAIADNGRGFDVMRLASGASRNFGLQFMRERAELMGASAPDRVTPG